jgi:hypothetical protein
MKYSIFHTSHCGSTLLACLLSKSIPTLTEPKWVHEIVKIGLSEERHKFAQDNSPENMLVKYSSLVCDVAPFIGGKTVLLYNNIHEHLTKLNSVDKSCNLKFESFFWAQRMFNVMQSPDILLVESNSFLQDTEKTVKEVCKFFEIEYKPLDFKIDFHVKEAGYNHSDTPIVVERKQLND